MLEKIALWWCYIAGATAAVGIYGLIFLWAAEQITAAFHVKTQILEWYWQKLRAERDKSLAHTHGQETK